jgi:hypothetical protein
MKLKKQIAVLIFASVALVGLTGCYHRHYHDHDHYPPPPPPHDHY